MPASGRVAPGRPAPIAAPTCSTAARVAKKSLSSRARREFVESARALPHRDAARSFTPPVDVGRVMHDAVIVGGGLAGLSCAVALAQSGLRPLVLERAGELGGRDRKSTRLNSSHLVISYAVFCLKKKKNNSSPPMTRYRMTV